ncbi:NUDIX hydrolase [archaeon]|nr:NUDIX hydrolase [Nanoarchaeota archaeon]MBU4300337.1 NUDIX hydrolase [Nanoarchaeota archaeon]MBU4452126.1 NUDIX hydrolase [Nanoarchaeota archaeon]MCG2724258.1 NUDIX hydrolase [archaeon]
MVFGVEQIQVAAVLFCNDGKGNYVLNYRANCRDENSKWDCGGEAAEPGETIEQTLRRGVLEEYCVPIISFEFLGCRYACREENGEKMHWILHDYRVLVDRDKVRNGEPHKFDEVGFFPLGEIEYMAREIPLLLHSGFPECLRRYSGRL